MGINYLMLEPTNKCTLNCAFCNRSEVVQETKNLSLDEFDKIIHEIRNYPIGNDITIVKLQGMGEPYLNPYFDEMCRRIRSSFFCMGFELISATNCQHDNYAMLDSSMKYIDMLYLSVDGTKKNYEKYRKGASWDKLIEFLKYISYQKYSKKCNINFIATHYNYKDIQELIELSAKYNIGDIRINIAQNWNEDEQGGFGCKKDFQKELRKYKIYIRGDENWEYKNCFWFKTGLYIDVFGNVRLCCLNTSGKSFGNIFTQDLFSIRYSEVFQNIIRSLWANKPPVHCKNCDYKRLAPILKMIKK